MALELCEAPRTVASRNTDGTVMADYENPIMNAAQYSNYEFDKSIFIKKRPEKMASGLNWVNKTDTPGRFDIVSVSQGRGQAQDLDTMPPSIEGTQLKKTEKGCDRLPTAQSPLHKGEEVPKKEICNG
jgi:hypothetical protein